MLTPASPQVLLTVDQMGEADARTIASGILGKRLMEAAGRAVAKRARRLFPGRPVLILAGPGNNGGDGYVAARHLERHGIEVAVRTLTETDRLSGDARWAFETWNGDVFPLLELAPDEVPAETVIVDALFGAGLTRPLEGAAAEWAEAVTSRGMAVVAVDVPSGVNGTTGEASGPSFHAVETVTFCRAKPGHHLEPGRSLCGQVYVADIGIPDDIIDGLAANQWANDPVLWRDGFPEPGVTDHKYSRGHGVIWGSADMPGAARLAAQAARRIGAGMITIAAEPHVATLYRQGAPGLVVTECGGLAEFDTYLADPRRRAALVGPGAGVVPETRDRVLAALTAAGTTTVIDADGISAFEGRAGELFDAISGPVVLTPHEGEFTRLFGDLEGDKLTRVRTAARISGAVVLLKGPDTAIADPEGQAVLNTTGTPFLATAGTGDVLAGMILGLCVQGMPAFLSAAAASWLHGEAARRFGRGLIAEDVAEQLPRLLTDLLPDAAGM